MLGIVDMGFAELLSSAMERHSVTKRMSYCFALRVHGVFAAKSKQSSKQTGLGFAGPLSPTIRKTRKAKSYVAI